MRFALFGGEMPSTTLPGALRPFDSPRPGAPPYGELPVWQLPNPLSCGFV